jgi:hypothetical protein
MTYTRMGQLKGLRSGAVAGLLATGLLTLCPGAATASTRTIRAAASVMTSGSDPTITNCDGRQEAFEVSSGVLLHRWQTSPGGSWSGWYSLGGYLIYSRIAVFDNVTCHLEVVGVGGDGAMWHIWQTNAGGGPWSGWASLGGGYFTGGPTRSGFTGGGGDIVWGWTNGGASYVCDWQENRGSGPWSGWHPASVCPSAITT